MAGKFRKKSSPIKKMIKTCLLVLIIGTVIMAVIGAFQVKAQLNHARALKADLTTVVGSLREEQTEDAVAAMKRADGHMVEIRQGFRGPFWRVLSAMPVGHTEMKGINGALDLWDEASRDLLWPTIGQLSTYPMSQRNLNGEVNNEWLIHYLEYAAGMIPTAKNLLESADKLNFGLLDWNGEISGIIDGAVTVVNVVDENLSDILEPSIQQLRAHPLSDLKEEEGFRADVIASYLDFSEQMRPSIHRLNVGMQDESLNTIAENKQFGKYVKTVRSLLETFDQNEDLMKFMRMFLGNGEDRNYLVAAMNSAEVRATGGFPGSMGFIQIQDGLIVIGDFTSIVDVMPRQTHHSVNATQAEVSMFSCSLTNMSVSWDSCLCPDFERVGEIWGVTTGAAKNMRIDGVIGICPTVIQDILSVVGSITLSDGTELNGENATVIIQHDMYFDHFGKEQGIAYNNSVVDGLFSETAKTTMKLLTHSFSVTRLPAYAKIAQKRFDDRSLMVWMRDEAEQAMVRELGYSGGLNADPNRPEAGVYINCITASKMGWFAVVEPEIGQPVFNADGTKTYPITVTLNNSMTQEEINTANYYITGGLEGALDLSLYLFAPAGGTIGDFEIDGGYNFSTGEYRNLQVGYLKYLRVNPGVPVVIHYQVTTAPNAEMPLEISSTPTLQDYHYQLLNR